MQTCSDLGVWSAPAPCQNACVGEACTGECIPGATRCSSETVLQTCNDQGQFVAGTPCPFACVGTACSGQCVPGSSRCEPTTGVPQLCSGAGEWQSQTSCPFVCSGSGSCTGECAPGSRRCSPTSGVPQLCGAAGTWENQAGCPFTCTDGACTGECTPGSSRCDPASGVPQSCSNASTWQNLEPCPRGCQNGTCIPQLGPGAACSTGNDCTTGFCVDGVCCQEACAGVCAQCEVGTGACVAPQTDPGCDPVICSSNECRLSSGDLTTNLCRGRGQCKDQSDCNFAESARGTPCDVATSELRLCDGDGSCAEPTVTCDGTPALPAGDAVCCQTRNGVAFPFDVTESYVAPTDCPVLQLSRPGNTRVTCDNDDDCRTGTVCCLTSAQGASLISCIEPTLCNTGGQFVTYREICGSPSGFGGTCPAGTACSAHEGELATGWSACVEIQ